MSTEAAARSTSARDNAPGCFKPSLVTRLTIFGMGHQLWGRAPRQLQLAVDAVERRRGLGPPLFVDIRPSRHARARGFNGSAFERLIGKKRYRWVKVAEDAGPHDEDPISARASTAADLLELALDAADAGHRVVMLGGVAFPKDDGRVVCSRYAMGTLLLQQARKYDVALDVVEWPGGNPRDCSLAVSDTELESVARGKTRVDLGPDFEEELAGLPWGSTAILRSAGRDLCRVVGPACGAEGDWSLPVLWPRWPKSPQSEVCHGQGRTLRRNLGLEPRASDG
jgi:hypothetical protein